MEIEIISASEAPQAIGPYSHAMRAGQFIFCAGQAGLDPKTGKMVEGGIREQTRQVISNLQAVLEAAGSDLSHVVQVTVMIHDWNYFKEMNEVFAEYFGQKRPARSTVQGERWPKGSLVAMDAIAVTK
jgi:2-iminobutanoate/2-iminopropanoate deaminase